jgi:hypothetical protein
MRGTCPRCRPCPSAAGSPRGRTVCTGRGKSPSRAPHPSLRGRQRNEPDGPCVLGGLLPVARPERLTRVVTARPRAATHGRPAVFRGPLRSGGVRRTRAVTPSGAGVSSTRG